MVGTSPVSEFHRRPHFAFKTQVKLAAATSKASCTIKRRNLTAIGFEGIQRSLRTRLGFQFNWIALSWRLPVSGSLKFLGAFE